MSDHETPESEPDQPPRTAESEELSKLYSQYELEKGPLQTGRKASRFDVVEWLRMLPGRFAMKEFAWALMVLILLGLLFYVAWQSQSAFSGIFGKYSETAEEISTPK